MEARPRRLDTVREKLRTRHYSYRKEQQDVHWIRRFILFHDKRHPVEHCAATCERSGAHRRNSKAGVMPHLSTLLCHSPHGAWVRHSHCSGTDGPRGRGDHADLHARHASRRRRRLQCRWRRAAGQFGADPFGRSYQSCRCSCRSGRDTRRITVLGVSWFPRRLHQPRRERRQHENRAEHVHEEQEREQDADVGLELQR